MKEIKGLKNILDSFGTKHVKFGGYAALITLAVVIALILANLAIGKFQLQFDMTENKVFSLSEQSVQVLDLIKEPVNVYGLWQAGQENTDITEVLDLYIARNKNIRYQTIDPERNPGFLINFSRERISPGSVIVEGAKGFRIIPPEDMYDFSTNRNNQRSVMGISVERRLTSAFLYVGTGQSQNLYEISGHNEAPLEELGLNDFISQENYTLRQLNLFTSNVPADASALVIVSPKSDITRVEADKILDYLDQGGRLFAMVDYRIQELPMLNEVLASFNVRFDYGIVIENDQTHTAGDFFMEIPDMQEHFITNPLKEKNIPVILPFSMGISETETKRRSVNTFPLLATSANSVLRSDIYNNAQGRIDSDKAGPITIAMAVTDPGYVQNSEKQTRIVLVGSSTVMSTPYGDYSIFLQQVIPGSNADLFMNSINWLAERPETLTVRSKGVFLLPMRMNALEKNIYTILFVIIIPVVFFVLGFLTWLKRRHL